LSQIVKTGYKTIKYLISYALYSTDSNEVPVSG